MTKEVKKQLSEQGLTIEMPDDIQDFGDNFIDLTPYPQIKTRLTEVSQTVNDLPQYPGQTLPEAISGTLKSEVFLNELTPEDKQTMVDKIVEDFNVRAKTQLTEEFPVLDQLVLDEQIKQQER